MGIEQVGVEAIVAGMGPFRSNAAEYNARIASMTGATKRAGQETSVLGQIAIGALRKIGALAVDGFLFAARHAARFIEGVLSATVKGTEFERTLESLRVRLLGVAKTELNPLFDQFNQLAQRAQPALEAFTQFAARTFATLASNAATWGENIVNQLAQGMWNAVGAVLEVLTSIGQQIANLLMPGSPPKLLPDLDDWGTEAMQVYLDGWGKASFDVFDELAGTIEANLRSLAPRDDTGLIPRILGTREAIAQAVDQVRRTGQVTDDVLQGIYTAAGATTAQLQGYVKSIFDLELANERVAAAQEELNSVTQKYNELLKPIDKQLAGISEAQQQLTEDQDIRRLQMIQNDPNALASEKEQARLKIEQILAERRRRALLAEQSQAVDAAQAKLDDAEKAQQAAQDQADAQRMAIQLATDQNNLMREQLDLVKRLAEAANRGGGAGAKGAGGIVKPVGAGLNWEDLVPDEIQAKWAEFQTAWAAGWAAIRAAMQPAVDAWNAEVVPAWNNLVTSIKDSLPDIEATIASMVAFVVTEMGVTLPTIFANVASSLNSLAEIWRNHHDTILAIVSGAFRLIVATIAAALTIVSGIVALALNSLSGTLDFWSLVFQGKWSAAWESAKTTINNAWEIITQTVIGALNSALAVVDTDLSSFTQLWWGVWENACTIISTAWERISEAVTAKAALIFVSIVTWIAQVINTFQTTDWASVGQGLIDGIAAGITGAIGGLATAAANAAAAALQAAKDALNIKSPSKAAAKLIGEPFSLGIAKGILDSIPAVQRAVQTATGTMVAAPAVAGSSYSYTDARSFTVAPTYNTQVAPSMQQDAAIMRVFWGR